MLPTSSTIHLHNNHQLTQRMAYDKYGRDTLMFDPIFGTVTDKSPKTTMTWASTPTTKTRSWS
jgi:hypothetical protein